MGLMLQIARYFVTDTVGDSDLIGCAMGSLQSTSLEYRIGVKKYMETWMRAWSDGSLEWLPSWIKFVLFFRRNFCRCFTIHYGRRFGGTC